MLKRPAVDNLLKKALKKPLTTVIAGAGFGKTQAVLSAIKSMGKCKSVWVQLSQLDNYSDRLWKRITYALEPYSHNLFQKLMSLGFPASIAAFDQFLRLLVSELGQEELFILIFDNFYLIHNQLILNFINLMVTSGTKNFSIVLISRKKPDLSLMSMLSKGLLSQITENNLRFSKDEMNAYYHKQGIKLDEDLSSDIFSYTDGWVFAICLIGMSIKKSGIRKQNPIRATRIHIFDLIDKEIFQTVSKELQGFLLKVSALNCIPVNFIKELIDDHHSIISEMAQISQFIRYDSLSDCYRIHHLFKEFLLERQCLLPVSDIRKMHIKAAKWHKKNKHNLEAIRLYKFYNLYDEICDIILSYSYHVAKETAEFFIDLIKHAPDEVIRKRPIIRVSMAYFMLNNNKVIEAEQELLQIRRDYEPLPETTESLAVLGEAYIALALISIIKVDYRFVDLLKKADEYLPLGSKIISSRFNIAEGLNVCSIKSPAEGELKKHQDAIFSAAPYASRVLNGCGYGFEYLNAAEYNLYTGELNEAKKYAYEAIYRSRQYQQLDIEYMANFVLVRIFMKKGNYNEIANLLEQMKTGLETVQLSEYLSYYDIIRGWYYVKIGRPDMVPKWIKYEEETSKMLVPVILGREYLVRSDCLLAEQRYDELLAFMKQTDILYNDRGILFAIIQNKITKAIIFHYMGDHTESITMLTEAYELTHPNGLIMQYIEYGNNMRTLIHAVRQHPDCKIPKEWLDQIYTKSSTYAKQVSQVVSVYNAAHAQEKKTRSALSKRETEVLTYLYRGMTRKEIAGTCYLSYGTVDGILKNIYAKLGVTKSTEAVRAAKERKLL